MDVGPGPLLVPEDILKKRAAFLGVDVNLYVNASAKRRAVLKAKFVTKIRKGAREVGVDEQTSVKAALAGFPEIPTGAEEKERSRLGQELVRLTPEKMEEIQQRAVRAVHDPEALTPSKFPPPFVEEDGMKIYHGGAAETPPAESDPLKRDGITIGAIVELEKPPVVDLVGDRPPRTLTDLYARWPIADDSSYYIRIERTRPKRHGGVDVAGFVGEVRGKVVKESDLHRWLGGTEYRLTVYGPDPRGKTDINDLPVIKPLTEPITLIVPVLPPNVGAIPAMQGDNMPNQNATPLNPFGPQASGATLTNSHDAAIHKTNMDFASNIMKMNQAGEEKAKRQGASESAGIFTYLAASQQTQADAARRSEEAQERRADKQLERDKDERTKSEKDMRDLMRAAGEKQQQGFDVGDMVKLLTTVGPNKEAESQRQSEYYRIQMDTMKSAHEESMKQLRDRHSEELHRSDDRLKDNESFYKRMSEDERTKSSERERDLRAEADKIRREERDMSAQRISETKERFESELRQADKSHEREMRSLKDSFEVKVDVADRTHEMQMQSTNERLSDAQADAEKAREEAKESSDPVKVMARAKDQAEAMGFEKPDDKPKTAMDRFAATAGAGLSQALSSINEWGPQVLAARKEQQTGQAPRGLPAGSPSGGSPLPPHPQGGQVAQVRQQVPPQQAAPRPPQRRRTRASTWATEEVSVRNDVVVPDTPLGFQTPENPVESGDTETSTDFVAAQPEAQHMTDSDMGLPPDEITTQIEVPKPQTAESQGFVLPEKVKALFSEEAIFGFLGQAETSVNGQIDPSVFGAKFHGMYPEEAKKMVENVGHAEMIEIVRGFPGSESSVLVTRDGEKWMEQLWEEIENLVTQ